MGRFVVKNVNFFLVFMLIIVLGSLIGISIYYERRFGDLSDDYIVTLKRMQEAEKYQGLYLEAIQSLNTTSRSIQFYDQLYENKTAELEMTKSEMGDKISSLTSKLQSTEGELTRTQDSLDKKIVLLMLAEATVEEVEDERDAFSNQLDDLKVDYDELEDDMDYYKNRASLFQGQRNYCHETHPGCYDGYDDD